MKLAVLVDNNTYIDRYFLGEPALSFFIEDDEKRILFDCGYSNVFFENARKMGIDLRFLDYLVLSHCHLDHTWGIETLIREYTEAQIEKQDFQKPLLVAHPKIFVSTFVEGVGEIGTLLSEDKIKPHFALQLSKDPVALTENLIFLGEIPRVFSFESMPPIGKKAGESHGDLLPDDTALAYKSEKGLVIITGCSHAGICNITEYAKEVCNEERVFAIIGGLHLLNPPRKQLDGTAEYIKDLNLASIYACHCTDFNSKCALSKVAPVKEVGVGLCVKF
jgi:7,8-dihydropterin-6-yl-methyl-4-(beta-D-ribofuranosyl)aminobenzene 5'-phosphate synthase